MEVQARFARPAFALTGPEANALHANIAEALAPFCTVTTDDIRISASREPLSSAHVTYNLPTLNAVGRVTLDTIEILFPAAQTRDTSEFGSVSLAFFRGVRGTIPDSIIGSYLVRLVMHCVVDDVNPLEFMGGFVTAPSTQDFGAPVGYSVRFMFGDEGSSTFSSVGAEMSATYSDAVFVSVVAVFDGTSTQEADLPDLAGEQIRLLLKSIGLEPSS